METKRNMQGCDFSGATLKGFLAWHTLSENIRELGKKVLLYTEEAFSLGEHLLGYDWYDVIGMSRLLTRIDVNTVASPTLICMIKDIRMLASKIACINKERLKALQQEGSCCALDNFFEKAEKYWKKGAVDEAVKCYERAGRYGHPWAYATLGDLFLEIDVQKALKYYKLGASEGIGDCEFALGLIYRDGADGVIPNLELAFKWIREAALHETCNAGNALGECYEKGMGCEKNLRKALYWYDVSQTGVENGDHVRGILTDAGERLPLRLDGFDYGITHYIQDARWWENYYLKYQMLMPDENERKSQ